MFKTDIQYNYSGLKSDIITMCTIYSIFFYLTYSFKLEYDEFLHLKYILNARFTSRN